MDVGTAFAAYGPWGIIGFVVLAIFKGWIVPREVINDIQKELSYNRERNKELEAQRNAAWAEAAKIASALSKLPEAPPKEAK